MKKEIFKKQNNHSKFNTTNDLNIEKLDKEIRLSLGVKKWEDSVEKEGYSGISITKKLDNSREVVVHWTLDGKNGFNIQFDEQQKNKIESVIKNHKKLTKD